MSKSQQQQADANWVPTNPQFDNNQPMQVGGQAVIEGVMMRGPKAIATAVRRANGSIVVKKDPYQPLSATYRWLKLPILRGAVGLIEMMFLGIKTLNFSADVAMADEAAKEGKTAKKSSQSSLALTLTLVASLAVGIGIFFVLPLFVATAAFSVENSPFWFNVTAGAIRIVILLAYLLAISMMNDVKRLFQYHGAEHKTVFTFELNDTLTPDKAQAYSRFHPRCGTSFLLIVALVAILAFALLDTALMARFGKVTFLMRLLTHLPSIPIVGGLSYEVIKFSARSSSSRFGKLLIAPGLWMQKITTREPDASQLEVACVALRCALDLEDASKYTMEETPAEQAA